MKYLGKITDDKDLVTKEYVDKTKIYYGVCSTAASTQNKTVTIDGITSLYEGLNIRIRFVNLNTYSGTPTLNVNSLGAKPIHRTSGTAMAARQWIVGEVLDFIYYNDSWVTLDGALASTSSYGVTELTNSTSSTSTTTAATPASVKAAYDLAAEAIPGDALVTSISSSSTDSQVPSAKLMYDTIGDVESVLTTLLEGTV